MDTDDLMDDNKIREAQEEASEAAEIDGTENDEVNSDEVNSDEVKNDEVKNDTTVASDEKEDQKQIELNNYAVLEYINKNREEKIVNYEDLFKQPESTEVIKEVNPYEDVFDDYDKSYFKFKKDTGLSRKEFDFVQQDFSKKSSLELAFDKVRRDNGGSTLTKEQISRYLERKLQIDLDVDEIDSADQIELNAFVKSYKEELIEQQEKYKITENPKKQTEKVAMVTLENGEQMPKEQFEKLKNQRKEYINNLKQDVSSATSFNVEIAFDNNGDKQIKKFNYEYSDNDRHRMISNATDVDNFISSKFRTEKGFDYKGLAEFIDKAENIEKYISLSYNQGRAEMLEEKIANDNNEQFSRTPKRSDSSEVKTVDDLMEFI